MSCFNSNCYLPQPPRAWSRVQNSCSLITSTDNSGLVSDPYTGEIVPATVLAERIAMLNKGNILQYKINSSNITKAQKYSLIAKGKWVNRNTTWAIQSTNGYTNPNTTSLKRVGNINIAIDPITGAIIGPTTDPPTCPKPIIKKDLPINNGGGSDIKDPDLPPPVPPSPTSDTFPPIIPDTPITPIVIQDGGVLICSIQENICTGETTSTVSQKICNPTTDSDVPGPIQDLCWNDGTQTWYPRQRYVMTNSTDKWPTNSGYNNSIPNGPPATLSSAIPLYPPTIISVTAIRNLITLTWKPDNTCLPTAYFDILENDLPFRRVNGNIFSIQFNGFNCSTYNYTIISTNGSVTSVPSNTVSIYIAYVDSPIDLNYNVISNINNQIQLNWNDSFQPCITISYYKIYQSGATSQMYLSTSKSIIINILQCNIYNFYVTAVDINGEESLPSNSIEAIIQYVNPPTNLSYTQNTNIEEITLYWTAPVVVCAPIAYYNIYLGNNIYTSYSTTITINNLENCSSYICYIIAVDTNGVKSDPSQNILVNVKVLKPVTIININPSFTSAIITWTPPTPPCITVAYYTVYQNSVAITTVPSSQTSYNAINLDICQDYSFYVTYFDGIESLPSNIETITLISVPPILNIPPPPNGIDNSQVNLNWTAPLDSCIIVSYKIYYSDGTYIGTSNTNSYLVTGLINGQTYEFYVKSNGLNNIESANSNIVSATLTIPDPPTNVLSSILSPSSATVTWTEPGTQNPTITYDVFYSTSNTGPWNLASSAIPFGTNTTNVTGLTSGTAYYFAVESINTYNIPSSLAITASSITIPYSISINATNFNASLSTTQSSPGSWNSPTGAIVFTDTSASKNFEITSFFTGTLLNILTIGCGGNGGRGGNGNGASIKGGGGGGGGSGGIALVTSINPSLLLNINVSITVAGGNSGFSTSASYSTVTFPFITYISSTNAGGTGDPGGDYNISNNPTPDGGNGGGGGSGYGNSTFGTVATASGGSGGHGDNQGGSGGGDGNGNSGNTYSFTVGSSTYSINYGGGGGGGSGNANSNYSGGSFGGGAGGYGSSAGGQETGFGAGQDISNIGSLLVSGGGGAGSSPPDGSAGKSGGSAAQGIVIVWWS
jgi:hypothetical protein